MNSTKKFRTNIEMTILEAKWPQELPNAGNTKQRIDMTMVNTKGNDECGQHLGSSLS